MAQRTDSVALLINTTLTLRLTRRPGAAGPGALRKEKEMDSEKVTTTAEGTRVKVTENAVLEDGKIRMKVEGDGIDGWVSLKSTQGLVLEKVTEETPVPESPKTPSKKGGADEAPKQKANTRRNRTKKMP